MLSERQITAIKNGFRSNCENEKNPIKKDRLSNGGKWLISCHNGIITWYEHDPETGKTVKYYDIMPSY